MTGVRGLCLGNDTSSIRNLVSVNLGYRVLDQMFAVRVGVDVRLVR